MDKLIIKPISFISKNVVQDQDLNRVLTQPAEYMIQTHNNSINIVNNLKINCGQTEYYDWNDYYKDYIGKNISFIIRDYVNANIAELVIPSIIKIRETYLQSLVFNQNTISIVIPEYPLHLQCDIMEYNIYKDMITLQMNEFFIYIFNDLRNSYYEFITNMVINNMDKINGIYSYLYNIVYNEEPVEKPVNEKYTFIHSILNEVIETELSTLLPAIEFIKGNAIQIALYHHRYINSLNYQLEDKK